MIAYSSTPLLLLYSQEEEITSKTNLSSLVYYDSNKKFVGADAFSCIDVVVTTYGTIQSQFASMSRSSGSSHTSPLLHFDWKRIILDEA